MYITWFHIKEDTLDFCENTKIGICDMLCCHGNNGNIVYLSDDLVAFLSVRKAKSCDLFIHVRNI